MGNFSGSLKVLVAWSLWAIKLEERCKTKGVPQTVGRTYCCCEFRQHQTTVGNVCLSASNTVGVQEQSAIFHMSLRMNALHTHNNCSFFWADVLKNQEQVGHGSMTVSYFGGKCFTWIEKKGKIRKIFSVVHFSQSCLNQSNLTPTAWLADKRASLQSMSAAGVLVLLISLNSLGLLIEAFCKENLNLYNCLQ